MNDTDKLTALKERVPWTVLLKVVQENLDDTQLAVVVWLTLSRPLLDALLEEYE